MDWRTCPAHSDPAIYVDFQDAIWLTRIRLGKPVNTVSRPDVYVLMKCIYRAKQSVLRIRDGVTLRREKLETQERVKRRRDKWLVFTYWNVRLIVISVLEKQLATCLALFEVVLGVVSASIVVTGPIPTKMPDNRDPWALSQNSLCFTSSGFCNLISEMAARISAAYRRADFKAIRYKGSIRLRSIRVNFVNVVSGMGDIFSFSLIPQ